MRHRCEVDEGDGEEKSPAIAATFSSFSSSLEEDPLEDWKGNVPLGHF
jgi:hypothetical protein